jgi:hypothetical protein
MGTTVFFRDDDVGGLTPGLRNVVETLIEERVPCNYQVVPMYLNAEGAAYMREKRRAHPDLVVLNQHGYRHEDHRDGAVTYEEFGGHRPYDDQLAAIAEGRRMLVEMLDGDFSGDVFTPPCHKYDENTLSALYALGFRVVSAGVLPGLGTRLYYEVGRALRSVSFLGKRVSYHGGRTPSQITELSGAVDVDPDINPGGRAKTFETLSGELERAVASQSIVGVMLHHETYNSPQKVETLRKFARWVRGRSDVQLKTIEAIADTL